MYLLSSVMERQSSCFDKMKFRRKRSQLECQTRFSEMTIEPQADKNKSLTALSLSLAVALSLGRAGEQAARDGLQFAARAPVAAGIRT
jgi:hypothetical protein